MSNDFDWNNVLKNPSIADVVSEIFKIGIDKPDKFKRTVLHAVVQKYHELEYVSALVDACIDIYVEEDKGKVICWQGEDKNLYAAILALTKVGNNMCAQDIDGLTPLHYAAWHNDNPEIISALMKNCPLNITCTQDNKGRIALHYAAQYNTNHKITLALMENKASLLSSTPDIRDKGKWIPLHYAAFYNTNLQVIKILLKETSRPKVKTFKEYTAYDLFMKRDKKLENTSDYWELHDELKNKCSE